MNMFRGKGIKLIVITGIAGMAFILLSDIFAGSDKSAEREEAYDMTVKEYESFVDETEKRLESTLEKISGVGDVEVMITAAGSGEYVYARDIKSDSGKDSLSQDEKYVIIGGSSDKKALIQKIDNPEITGVVVVCEGGDSNVVKEKVCSAVAAAFNLPSNKIYVTGSK